jgi:hypothetical protein
MRCLTGALDPARVDRGSFVLEGGGEDRRSRAWADACSVGVLDAVRYQATTWS